MRGAIYNYNSIKDSKFDLKKLPIRFFSVRKSTFYQFLLISSRIRLFLTPSCASMMKITLCHMLILVVAQLCTLKLLQKMYKPIANGHTSLRPVELSWVSHATINKTVIFDWEHIYTILVTPQKLWGLDLAASLTLNHTLDRHPLTSKYAHPSTYLHKTETFPFLWIETFG